jgi:molybdenum cofactor guanylyltransferase
MRSPSRSAAILAGGRATRFGGRDKSTLVVDGRTIFDRQCAELATVDGLEEILLVGAPAARAGTRLVPDIVPGLGPLGGIHAALTHAHSDAVCVIACDMPYVTGAFVSRLFAALPGNDVEDVAAIVVPQTDRGYHPLCAVYTRACLDAIARRLAGGKLKVMDLFADVRTRVVTLVNADLRLVANVNTPEAFAALHGHYKT